MEKVENLQNESESNVRSRQLNKTQVKESAKKKMSYSWIEPFIDIQLKSIDELQNMCRDMKLTLNKMNYNNKNEENKSTGNSRKIDVQKFSPIIDCIESLNELRKKAEKMGLKTSIQKRRKKKKGMLYSIKKRPQVEKPLQLPTQYWAESISQIKLSPNMHLLYFIKWEGYEHKENTWQTIDDLQDCHLLFEDFHRLQFKHNKSVQIDYTEHDFQQFHRCLRETCSEKGDIAVLLKLNSKKVSDYDHSYKTVKVLKAKIEPFLSAFSSVKPKRDLWPAKILIQHLVNQFNIEDNFGDLRQFFHFVDKRKQVLIALKEWEQHINEAIVESEAQEKTILVENNIDLEIPPKLRYITRYKFHKNVSIDSTKLQKNIKCECDDNCQKNRSCVCALKIYRDNKRFKSSNVIYECNDYCKCDDKCPNRRVQKGREFQLIVFRTDDRGWGVMTAQKIPYKAFIMEYIGEIIGSLETEERDPTYFFNIDEEFCGKCVFVDGKRYGNITRFANHCCSPNMDMHMAVINDQQLLPRIAFFANRLIKPYEELTYDYGRKTLSIDQNGDYCNDNGSVASVGSVDSGISCDGSDSDCRARKRSKTSNSCFISSVPKIACLCGSEKCKKVI